MLHLFICLQNEFKLVFQFGKWFCGKTPSDLENVICDVLVKDTPGKHAWKGALTITI